MEKEMGRLLAEKGDVKVEERTLERLAVGGGDV